MFHNISVCGCWKGCYKMWEIEYIFVWEHESEVIQARSVFDSVLIMLTSAELCQLGEAHSSRYKSVVNEMSQTALLSEISFCSKALQKLQVKSTCGSRLMCSDGTGQTGSHYLMRWWKLPSEENKAPEVDSVNWEIVIDRTFSVLRWDSYNHKKYDLWLMMMMMMIMILPETKKLSACNLSLRNPCWIYLGAEFVLVIDNQVQRFYFHFKQVSVHDW